MPLLAGLISLLLMVELIWSLLAGFQTRSYQLGASYIRWKNTTPAREYRLIKPQQLPRFMPIMLEIANANQRHQRWILKDKHGHVFTLEMQASGIRSAGWRHYTFTVLQWQMPKESQAVAIVREYSRGSIITYLFFYDVSNQQLGHAVLYWRT